MGLRPLHDTQFGSLRPRQFLLRVIQRRFAACAATNCLAIRRGLIPCLIAAYSWGEAPLLLKFRRSP